MTVINTLFLTLVTHATAACGANTMLGYGADVQVRAGRKAAVMCVHLLAVFIFRINAQYETA